MAVDLGLPFLVDEKDGKGLHLRRTFLFDTNRQLVYRGQLDDSRPSNGKPVTGEDLRAAIDAVLAGKPVNPEQKPSVGCNIKWKPGKNPAMVGVASKLKALNSFSRNTTFAQAASSSNGVVELD